MTWVRGVEGCGGGWATDAGRNEVVVVLVLDEFEKVVDEALRSCAPNPILVPDESRLVMIFSNPTNAPANTNRIFVVSMVYCSLLPGCCDASLPPRSILSPVREFACSDLLLRSDLALTVTVVPSIIFKRPCWTPSPDTSLPCVMTAGLASLSSSSKNMIPVSHFWISLLAASNNRSMEDSMSVPM